MEKYKEDFDFDSFNAKMEKATLEENSDKGYDKSDGFFDNLKPEVRTRENNADEQNKDTFGTTGKRRGGGYNN